eukprot:Awhi_evm1s2481
MIYSLPDLKAPTKLGGVNLVDLRARNDATKSKIMAHMFECYEKEEFTMKRKDIHVRVKPTIQNNYQASAAVTESLPFYYFLHLDYTALAEPTLDKPPDFITDGIYQMRKYQSTKIAKSPNVSHLESFLLSPAPDEFQDVSNSYREMKDNSLKKYIFNIDLVNSFPKDIAFVSNTRRITDMTPFNYEGKVREALKKDNDWDKIDLENRDENLLKLNRNLVKNARVKARKFNFILKPPKWDSKSCSKVVKKNYNFFREVKTDERGEKLYDPSAVIKKWYDPDGPKYFSNPMTTATQWKVTLKQRKKDLEDFSPRFKPFAWSLLNQRLNKR